MIPKVIFVFILCYSVLVMSVNICVFGYIFYFGERIEATSKVVTVASSCILKLHFFGIIEWFYFYEGEIIKHNMKNAWYMK